MTRLLMNFIRPTATAFKATRGNQIMARHKITKRTPERLIKAAYEYEYLAGSLREEGYESIANGIAAIASKLGDIGRSLDRLIDA